MFRNLATALGVCLALASCNDSPTTDLTAPTSDVLEPQALVSLEANTWATLTKTRAPRARVAGAAIGNVIYLVGGWRFTLFNEDRGSWATSSLQAYDVGSDRSATDRWGTLPRPPSKHASPAAGVIKGKFYLVGGAQSFSQPNLAVYLGDRYANERFDPGFLQAMAEDLGWEGVRDLLVAAQTPTQLSVRRGRLESNDFEGLLFKESDVLILTSAMAFFETLYH